MSSPGFGMGGFTLLPVMLTMGLIAAIAFLLNRDNAINADMVSGQLDTDRARYAAEAGLQAANARVQSLGCAGGFPTSGAPTTNSNFGVASYSAYATSASGNTTSLVSTGTFNSTSVTLTRSNIIVYQAAAKTYTPQPAGGTGTDTYIVKNSATNFGAANTLNLNSSTDFPLLKFDLSSFPSGSVPLSVTLSVYAGSGLGIGTGNVYRMQSNWLEGTSASSPVDGANWTTTNGTTAWTVAGGDHHSAIVASAGAVTGAWMIFDITDLAAAWLSGRYPNNGVMLGMTAGLGTLDFTSSDNSDAAHRPKLTINYLVPCGSTGPSDPTGGTFTLSATADSFNDSGAVQANNGAAATLKVYYTPARENRMLMRFDTSSIPAGSAVQSATLRVFVSAIASGTANTKSIWINAVNDAWVEGAGNNTNKACPTTTAGTSWNYSTNCSSWSYVHPPNTAPAWTAMASMPTARTGHVVAMVNSKIYAIGGELFSGTALNVVEEYNPATNTWSTKASMTTARSNSAGAVVNGKIYVMGGMNTAGTALSVNEMYDPVANTWTNKTAMPAARRSLSAGVVNNKIYAIGGATTTAALKTNEEYDPVANSWTSKAQMAAARMWPAVQGVNGKVFVLGGWSGTQGLDVNAAYDPTANSWSNKQTIPDRTDSMSSAVLGRNIYFIGGLMGSVATNAVWRYDTMADSYLSRTNYPLSADLAGASTVGNMIYAMGGDNNISTVYANHYRYDPGLPVPVATAVDEATSASPLAANFSGGWISFDLKTLVQEWVSGTRPNNGMVFYSDIADQFSINSRESGSKTPQLVVTY
jgi:N-acetylneuraminic acid mutarotase/Tfp pilus assembly protein PilX